MIKVLFIGHSGYLGQHILNSNKIIKYNVTLFKGRVQDISNFEKYMHYNFDMIWHFGSPNNANAKDLEKSIIKGTLNVIAFANQQHAKLVYASSQGIFSANKNQYEIYKKTATVMVANSCEKYINLIIPRVYSRDRNHELIKAIKTNKPLDLDKEITFLNISEFVTQFFIALSLKNDNYVFKNLKRKSIQDIKNWILK